MDGWRAWIHADKIKIVFRFQTKSKGLSSDSVFAATMPERVIGLDCKARMGQRVQLSEQGRKSLDEKFHNFSGGRAGTIVAVMAEIPSVRACTDKRTHQSCVAVLVT